MESHRLSSQSMHSTFDLPFVMLIWFPLMELFFKLASPYDFTYRCFCSRPSVLHHSCRTPDIAAFPRSEMNVAVVWYWLLGSFCFLSLFLFIYWNVWSFACSAYLYTQLYFSHLNCHLPSCGKGLYTRSTRKIHTFCILPNSNNHVKGQKTNNYWKIF